MPELPEVETMARDLAPLVSAPASSSLVGLASPHPPPGAGCVRPAVRGRPVVRVGSARQVAVLDLGDDAVLAIQVKMTGQLFVLPRAPSTTSTCTCD